MSFRIAKKVAKNSEHSQHRLGAVIVKGGNILATGYNQLRYTRELGSNTLHAEEAAILKLLNGRDLGKLPGSTIYVSRTTKGGHSGLARPCHRCAALIRAVGISTICYTTDTGTMTEKVC